MKVCSLFSGSKGNCIYLETDRYKFLIDAGFSGSRIEQALQAINRSAEELDMIFVTHEHTDHIGAVGILSRRYKLPVYITEKTYMAAQAKLGQLHELRHFTLPKTHYSSSNEIKFHDLLIRPFSVEHDAVEPVGFEVYSNGRKFSLATDMGKTTPLVQNGLKTSNVILIETNYDLRRLPFSKYPPSLIRRIRSSKGHLENTRAFNFLTSIYESTDKLHTVICGHLSQENNSYEKVEEIARRWCEGKSVKVIVARQEEPTGLIEI